MANAIDLKGSILSFSILVLNSADIRETKVAIAEKISQMPDFFSGSPVVLEPKIEIKDATYLALLLEHLRQLNLIPIGIRTTDPTLVEQAGFFGLGVFSGKSLLRKKQTTTNSDVTPISAQIVNKTIRSGQQVYAKDRDLVVFGDINPGGEALADGNLHVYGKIKGKAFAGASGNTEARIYASNIHQPELICIAGAFELDENIKQEYKQGLVEICLKGESIIFNHKT